MSKKIIVEGSPEWESICQQCGICCLVKVNDVLGNVYLTNVRCAALDKDTRKCACYAPDMAHRDNGCLNCAELGGTCVTRVALNSDYLVPSFCPYAQKFCKDKSIRTAPKQRPDIDWSETISETELGEKEPLWGHIIPGSEKYFQYNPNVNKILHENLKQLNLGR